MVGTKQHLLFKNIGGLKRKDVVKQEGYHGSDWVAHEIRQGDYIKREKRAKIKLYLK